MQSAAAQAPAGSGTRASVEMIVERRSSTVWAQAQHSTRVKGLLLDASGLGGRGRAGRGRAESRGMMGGRGQAYRPFDAASGTHRSTRVLGEAHVQHLRSRTATKLKAADLARDIRTSVAASPVEQVRQRSRARSA